MPSRGSRSRQGSDTAGGSQPHDRSWSATTNRMLGEPDLSGTSVGLRHELLGPRVVGLAARRTADLVDQVQLARHLVAGDLRAAVRAEFVNARRATCPWLHDGD